MKWWSASKRNPDGSKGGWKVLAEMADQELLNAFRKLGRGEYVEQDGEPPATDDTIKLTEAFEAEMARRELDPEYPNGRKPREQE